MINLDIRGRLDGIELPVFGTGTAPGWEEVLDSVAHHDSLSVTRSASGSGASDHASFYEIGIPVLHYFSGTHEDYHRPSDTADKLDYEGMEWILDHVKLVIRDLAARDLSFLEFTETGGRRSMMMPQDGVSLGVVPDYNFSGGGFRINSVRSGSVAEQSGFEGGDVIVRMDEMEILDIYGYMEALGSFERGDSIVITVLRNGDRLELNVNF
jgi:C-terminal processing protease CtpA/Prc